MANKVKIYNMDVKYDVNYRNIKYPRLEFKSGELLLVLPKEYSEHRTVIEKHKQWIYNKNLQISNALRLSKTKKLNLKRSNEEFRRLVDNLVTNFLSELQLKVNKIVYKQMNSKWASCSSRKNLTINTLLKNLPNRLVEYVVYHEIVHLIERKHNERFWKIINQKYEDHQAKEIDLLIYWFLVQRVIKKD